MIISFYIKESSFDSLFIKVKEQSLFENDKYSNRNCYDINNKILLLT